MRGYPRGAEPPNARSAPARDPPKRRWSESIPPSGGGPPPPPPSLRRHPPGAPEANPAPGPSGGEPAPTRSRLDPPDPPPGSPPPPGPPPSLNAHLPRERGAPEGRGKTLPSTSVSVGSPESTSVRGCSDTPNRRPLSLVCARTTLVPDDSPETRGRSGEGLLAWGSPEKSGGAGG